MIFRPLTEQEVQEFTTYAQTHDPDLAAWEILHPVCRAEWVRLGKGPKRKWSCVRRVNHALKKSGRAERLMYDIANDYFYFYAGNASSWPNSGVYVSRNEGEGMTTDRWMAEFSILGEIG
jgi:hypothetical protein